MTHRDRELGMARKITRRDFLDGVALAIGSTAVAPFAFGGAVESAEGPAASGIDVRRTNGSGIKPRLHEELPTYPPTLTGLRGDQDKVYEVAHRLRDGKAWESFGTAEEEKDFYDLIVVGAGISGLAAAYFYRELHGNRGF
jgi:spermidine dehydrogenase